MSGSLQEPEFFGKPVPPVSLAPRGSHPTRGSFTPLRVACSDIATRIVDSPLIKKLLHSAVPLFVVPLCF